MDKNTPKEKLMKALIELKEILSSPSKFALAKFFENNNLAKDYSAYVLEYRLIIKVEGGTRGRSVYVWNKGIKITQKVINSLLQRFNDYRNYSASILKKSNKEELKKEFATINKKLDQIFNKLNQLKPIV